VLWNQIKQVASREQGHILASRQGRDISGERSFEQRPHRNMKATQMSWERTYGCKALAYGLFERQQGGYGF
jgi:hypothetical protein